MYHTIYIVNNNPFLVLLSGAWYSTGWVGPSRKASERHLGEIGRDCQCHWHHTASAGEWAGMSVQEFLYSCAQLVLVTWSLTNHALLTWSCCLDSLVTGLWSHGFHLCISCQL